MANRQPSSATASAAVGRTARSRTPAMPEQTAERPLAAALWFGGLYRIIL
jgi:hypothetical protein